MAKKLFKVLSPIKLESDTLTMPGETVEIEEKHARELLALGVVELSKDAPPPKPAKGGGGA